MPGWHRRTPCLTFSFSPLPYSPALLPGDRAQGRGVGARPEFGQYQHAPPVVIIDP